MHKNTFVKWETIYRYFVLCVVFLIVIFPYYWIVVTSFKTMGQISSAKSIFIPNPFTLKNYTHLIKDTHFLLWFKNSLSVAIVTVIITLILSNLAAYSIGRIRFRGKKLIATLVLVFYLFPPTVIFIPLYLMLNKIGLTNKLEGVMLIYPTITLAFSTWFLISFYRSIPMELEEAALIDGASRFQAFRKVILPLTLPAQTAAAIFSFSWCWDEFLYALVFLQDVGKQTMNIGVYEFSLADIYPWGLLMSAGVLMSIPVIVLYVFVQKYMIRGLTAGAVKE
ncbi:carbohydrate ABC transporter permease [Candidatus Aerophobetes bacterium]|uniref:Carbohydrate ABC transporter permease n=1 Tax=Aerophobetes bacterium TaxID=2030807 RepID=A0A662DBX2_UNCAE|nr:MAG: carbohydrate ABC transporter permease [Candidatus Aerophobetes bacterium]